MSIMPPPEGHFLERQPAGRRKACASSSPSLNADPVQRALLALVILSAAAGQQPRRPGRCVTAAEADSNWTRFRFVGLRLTLVLPPDLRPVADGSLKGVARRLRAQSIPLTTADTVRLLAAWVAPGKSTGDVRQVLFYSVRPDSTPSGRPCALTIADQPGLVFRMALSPPGRAADEYWMEAYWPGFVLAASGPTVAAYEAIFGILRSIAVSP